MKVLVQNKTTSSFGIPLFYTSMANLILALVLPAFGGDQRILFPSTQVQKYNVEQWIGLFVPAILGIAQYSARFMAIKLISPTLVSFIRTSEIILAYIASNFYGNTSKYNVSDWILLCYDRLHWNHPRGLVSPKIASKNSKSILI